MKQLTLDIRPDAAPVFDNFVPGANADLLAALAETAHPGLRNDNVYLWGPPGCGRTHLLKAVATAAGLAGRPACYLRAGDLGDNLPQAHGLLLAIDDAGKLGADAQIALFRAYNSARQMAMTLVVSGSTAPLGLPLREDLRTRVGQSLVFEVKPLTDEDRAAIFATHAEARGLRVEPELLQYLLRHGARDLPSLLGVLDALDAASLERKRPITLPLLREVMQQGFAI